MFNTATQLQLYVLSIQTVLSPKQALVGKESNIKQVYYSMFKTAALLFLNHSVVGCVQTVDGCLGVPNHWFAPDTAVVLSFSALYVVGFGGSEKDHAAQHRQPELYYCTRNSDCCMKRWC